MTIEKYFKNICFFIIRLLFGFKGKKGCTVNILITQTQTLGAAFQVLCTGVHSLSICTVQRWPNACWMLGTKPVVKLQIQQDKYCWKYFDSWALCVQEIFTIAQFLMPTPIQMCGSVWGFDSQFKAFDLEHRLQEAQWTMILWPLQCLLSCAHNIWPCFHCRNMWYRKTDRTACKIGVQGDCSFRFLPCVQKSLRTLHNRVLRP